jgi:hypothetical protein
LGVERVQLPDGGAGGEHFDQREAQASHLVFDCTADGAAGVHDLFVVA